MTVYCLAECPHNKNGKCGKSDIVIKPASETDQTAVCAIRENIQSEQKA